jgi:MFS family permease
MIARTSEDPAHPSDDPSTAFLFAIVFLTFVMNTVGRGVTETFAVFLLPVQKAFGVSRADIASTYSIYMLGYALAAPLAGQIVDRLGARAVYAVGLLCLGAGYLAAGSATALWHYFIAVGVLGGFGAAMLGMVAASALLSRWFTARIGWIMSLPYAAVGAGMMIVPPATQVLLATTDWRIAYKILGIGVLALIPLLFVLPLGRIDAGSEVWQEKRAAAAKVAGGWTVSTALRTTAFWGLFSAYFFTSVAAYSVLPHSVAYLIERGFDPLVAATAFGATGLLSAFGIVGIGWLSDRIGRRQAATISYLSTIAGITALILVTIWPTLLLAYTFVVFFGLMQGARGPILVAMVSVLFAGGGVGAIYGTLSLALGLGAALGSWLSGFLYEWTGSYVASFVTAVGAALTGMAMFWLLPSLRHERVAPVPVSA